MDEKFAALLKDKAVVEELLQQETAEDAQKFLASKGVELSIEEINNLKNFIAQDGDEMDDSQLENVSGGSWIGDTLKDVIVWVKNSVENNRRNRW